MAVHVAESATTGRRRKGAKRTHKAGWQVSASVAEAVREAVEDGAAESQNAFVERALVRELRELRKKKVFEAYAEAARDPEFRHDMEATAKAFDATVSDGLRSGRVA